MEHIPQEGARQASLQEDSLRFGSRLPRPLFDSFPNLTQVRIA